MAKCNHIKLENYLRQCENTIKLAKENYKNKIGTDIGDKNLSLDELNDMFYRELVGELYEESFANPDYIYAEFGNEYLDLLSAIYYDVRKIISKSYFRKNSIVEKMIINIEKLLKEMGNAEIESIKKLYSDFRLEMKKLEIEFEMSIDLSDETLNDIVMKSNLNNSNYLYNYGIYIDKYDVELAEYINNYDDSKIREIAESIVNAFLHGFISQNRKRRDRTGIKLTFVVGQERIVRDVISIFNSKGIYPKVFMVKGHEEFIQYNYDHRNDEWAVYGDEDIVKLEEFYRSNCEINSQSLKNICGMIGIGSFGEKPKAPLDKNTTSNLSEKNVENKNKYAMRTRGINDKFIKPSDISFCKVAFPNTSIKGDFDKIFYDFVAMNTVNSEKYEVYQQKIIDVLDKGEYVKVVGRNGNITDITVAMNPIKNPDKETNYMNCGGDLNIPHGEVFTTPQLKGTTGKIHFKSIFLKGYDYKDLIIDFKDGYVSGYSCSNFTTELENKNYIENTLFEGKANISMGEFAIGTNTLAYETVEKHAIVEELPILLVEKMGPHFAIGDPCYAFGEDGVVYNMLDKKEIIAKENERTKARNEDIGKAYTGIHVDMTVPYEDIKILKVINSREEIILLEDGIYAIEGLDELNKPLLRMKEEKEMFKTECLKYIGEFKNSMDIMSKKLEDPMYFDKSTVKELQKDNELMYKKLLAEDYSSNIVNPAYAFDKYGENGQIISAIGFELYKMIPFIFRKKKSTVDKYNSCIVELESYFEKNDFRNLKKIYLDLLEIKEKSNDIEFKYEDEFLDEIVKLSEIDEKYIFRYGYYVQKDEYLTANILRKLKTEGMLKSGDVIAKAYDKGFVMAGKDKKNRRITKVQFHLGQEPLAMKLVNGLIKIGYEPKVTDVFPIGVNSQCEFDHKDDIALVLDGKYLENYKNTIESNYSECENTLRGVAGFSRLLQFGKVAENPEPRKESVKLSDDQKNIIKEMLLFERGKSSEYMPKSEMSYTGAAYPNCSIDYDRYEAILEEIININNMDADECEIIQNTMIDALDQADYVYIKGNGANKTDLKVNIAQINNSEKETVFKNTGADVNLPLGEVFTSPVLEKTTGILHVSETYRESFRYEELILKFEDGMVVDYSCENTKSTDGSIAEKELRKMNREYIEKTLLYPYKSLPMGEFAIGTNTKAYVTSKKFDIIDKLPGLIVEKMGPHFAIGDTCFAYGEDVTVTNIISNKEMIAKENSISKERKTNPGKAYFNTHTDITLPYEDIEFIKIVKYNGDEVYIIKDGYFVLEGTESLSDELRKM